MYARSLYIHFPYCESKCHYCDFYSLGREHLTRDRKSAFFRALEAEAWLQAPLLATELDTLYIGGGTPSLMSPDEIAGVLHPIRNKIKNTTEWTMEANPSSISANSLGDCRKLGINRLSMGVQSLDSALLKMLGRIHSPEIALSALETVFHSGIENVSVDLLCGVPGQTTADLEKSLKQLTAFPIKHLSCYLLTLSPGNPLFGKLPTEDTQLEHLLFVDRWLTAHGFEHYEISNFAKPGWRSLHNLNYWMGEAYLALGPSAHSYDLLGGTCGRRWKNHSSVDTYCSKLLKNESAQEWEEDLTPGQKEIERWMLALRLSDGFPVSWLDTSRRLELAAQLQKEGLLQPHPSVADRLTLTPKGLALSDEIISTLI